MSNPSGNARGGDRLIADSALYGGDEACERFVRMFSPLVLHAVRATLEAHGSPDPAADSEDASQEVFLKLLSGPNPALKDYDPCRASLSTWISAVARNAAVDFSRSNRAAARLAAIGFDVPEPAPAADSHGEDSGWARLTPRQKSVLDFIFRRGVSVSETAAILGVTDQTVRSQKHKALQILRSKARYGTAEA